MRRTGGGRTVRTATHQNRARERNDRVTREPSSRAHYSDARSHTESGTPVQVEKGRPAVPWACSTPFRFRGLEVDVSIRSWAGHPRTRWRHPMSRISTVEAGCGRSMLGGRVEVSHLEAIA
jgi:hypothetical protein